MTRLFTLVLLISGCARSGEPRFDCERHEPYSADEPGPTGETREAMLERLVEATSLRLNDVELDSDPSGWTPTLHHIQPRSPDCETTFEAVEAATGWHPATAQGEPFELSLTYRQSMLTGRVERLELRIRARSEAGWAGILDRQADGELLVATEWLEPPWGAHELLFHDVTDGAPMVDATIRVELAE